MQAALREGGSTRFRPPPIPAPPTAGSRAPRGMPGAPRSPRPLPAPRAGAPPPPLPSPQPFPSIPPGAAGACSDAGRDVLTRPILASAVSSGDRREGGGSSRVGFQKRVRPPRWSGSPIWLGSLYLFHCTGYRNSLAAQDGHEGAPGPVWSGE